MKPPPPPPDFETYTQDRTAGLMHRAPKAVLFVIVLGSVVCAFILGEKHAAIGYLIAAAVVSLGLLLWLSRPRRRVACKRCGSKMDVLDIDWTAALFRSLGGHIVGSFFVGADGRIYKEGRYRGSDSVSSYDICVVKQRWHVCYRCRRYFLGDSLHHTEIFKAGSGMRQAMNNLKTDPEVGREMERCHAERQ